MTTNQLPGVYVHVPFCHSKCAYCDFYSMPRRELAHDYIDALANEWNERHLPEINTLYIGGGTPSCLHENELTRLINLFQKPKSELTIEVNPEDVISPDSSLSQIYHLHPRISMGVQSLDDNILQLIGRRHSAAHALEAVKILRNNGITNLSLDLIYGLPGQTLENWQKTLSIVLNLHPEHLSCYCLSYEPGTRLTAMVKTGKIKPAEDATIVKMYEMLIAMAQEAGYEHYEISNFALPGFQSVHNSNYWNSTSYIGLGPGAHSYFNGIRSYNPPDLKDYLNKQGQNTQVIENENDDERFNDYILTRLRTAQGIDLITAPDRDYILKMSESWLEKGYMSLEYNKLAIPEQHWLISDEIIRDLIKI